MNNIPHAVMLSPAADGFPTMQQYADHVKSFGETVLQFEIKDAIMRQLIEIGVISGFVIQNGDAIPTGTVVGQILHTKAHPTPNQYPLMTTYPDQQWDGTQWVEIQDGNSANLVAQAFFELADKSVLMPDGEVEPCRDDFLQATQPIVPVVWDANVDRVDADTWVQGLSGLIRKTRIQTDIDPDATANPDHSIVYGSTTYTEEEFAALQEGSYCSAFAALGHLFTLSTDPLTEFGKYNPDHLQDTIVQLVGSLESDESIEIFNANPNVLPPYMNQQSANDSYNIGTFYIASSDGKVYERIGNDGGGVDPDATGNPNYATTWNPTGLYVEDWLEIHAPEYKLRINIQHDNHFIGEGNEASNLELKVSEVALSLINHYIPMWVSGNTSTVVRDSDNLIYVLNHAGNPTTNPVGDTGGNWSGGYTYLGNAISAINENANRGDIITTDCDTGMLTIVTEDGITCPPKFVSNVPVSVPTFSGNGANVVVGADGLIYVLNHAGNPTTNPVGDTGDNWSGGYNTLSEALTSINDNANEGANFDIDCTSGEMSVTDQNGNTCPPKFVSNVPNSVPSFSGDGTQVVVGSDNLIYVLNHAGNPTTNPVGDTGGNWSGGYGSLSEALTAMNENANEGANFTIDCTSGEMVITDQDGNSCEPKFVSNTPSNIEQFSGNGSALVVGSDGLLYFLNQGGDATVDPTTDATGTAGNWSGGYGSVGELLAALVDSNNSTDSFDVDCSTGEMVITKPDGTTCQTYGSPAQTSWAVSDIVCDGGKVTSATFDDGNGGTCVLEIPKVPIARTTIWSGNSGSGGLTATANQDVTQFNRLYFNIDRDYNTAPQSPEEWVTVTSGSDDTFQVGSSYSGSNISTINVTLNSLVNLVASCSPSTGWFRIDAEYIP